MQIPIISKLWQLFGEAFSRTPTDKDLAQYDSASGQWKNIAPTTTSLGLGSAANFASTAFDAAGAAAAAQAASQPLDATLTAFATLTIAANSLTVGSGADAFSQTAFAANTFPARSSSGNLVAKTITDFGLSLVDDADASTARATLGLGTLATQSGTFSGTSSGSNSGDQTITLTGMVTGSGTGSFVASLGSFTSAQLAAALTDETGSGNAVFSASPTFTGTIIGAATTLSGTSTIDAGSGNCLVLGNAQPVPAGTFSLSSINTTAISVKSTNNSGSGSFFRFGNGAGGITATMGELPSSGNIPASSLYFSGVSNGIRVDTLIQVGAARFFTNAAGTIGLTIQAAASRSAALVNFQTSAAGSLGNVSAGCVGDVFADVATTSTDGTLDTLRTDTYVANALIVNGDKIPFDYTLTAVASVTATSRFLLSFAGITIFDTGALTIGNLAGVIRIKGYITRKTATTARATIEFDTDTTTILFAPVAYTPDGTLTGLTLTGTNNLVLKAARAGTGAANGDIVLAQGQLDVKGFGS